jgi:mannose-6-phosphate isomerase-like protein (cupin superfamily)
MTGWVGDVDRAAKENRYFRQVVFTGADLQLVVMTLQPGEDIGLEVHDRVEQLIRVESGRATVTLGPTEHEVTEAHDVAAGWAVVVPAGTWHNVVNEGAGELALSTVYAPPQHADGTVHKTKAEALAAEAEHA